MPVYVVSYDLKQSRSQYPAAVDGTHRASRPEGTVLDLGRRSCLTHSQRLDQIHPVVRHLRLVFHTPTTYVMVAALRRVGSSPSTAPGLKKLLAKSLFTSDSLRLSSAGC